MTEPKGRRVDTGMVLDGVVESLGNQAVAPAGTDPVDWVTELDGRWAQKGWNSWVRPRVPGEFGPREAEAQGFDWVWVRVVWECAEHPPAERCTVRERTATTPPPGRDIPWEPVPDVLMVYGIMRDDIRYGVPREDTIGMGVAKGWPFERLDAMYDEVAEREQAGTLAGWAFDPDRNRRVRRTLRERRRVLFGAP